MCVRLYMFHYKLVCVCVCKWRLWGFFFIGCLPFHKMYECTRLGNRVGSLCSQPVSQLVIQSNKKYL